MVSLAEEIHKRATGVNQTFAQYRCREVEDPALQDISIATNALWFVIPTVIVVLVMLCTRAQKKVKPKIN